MTWDFLWFLIPIAGIIFAFLLASRKGKNKLIKMNIGEVLEDYGNFSELQDQQLGISSDQNLRLLKCKSKEGIIYVLEAQRGYKGILGYQNDVQWYKLSKNDLEKLQKLLNEKVLRGD